MEIWRYDNYRTYLRDRYEMVRKEKWFSCRKFAEYAGFSNPGYMNDVIAGRRPLSKSAAAKLADYFKLTPAERSFFELLTEYGNAKTEDARETAYRRLQARRKRSRFARVDSRYYDDFRYPLIRTALMAVPFYGDYESFAKQLRTAVSTADLKRLIRNLCSWGAVDQNEEGRYVVIDRFVEPDPELSGQMKMLHREWIRHGMTALDQLPREQRHISSQLLAVTESAAQKIREEIELFRERIWKIAEEDTAESSELIQLNIQCFPQLKQGVRS